MGYYLDRFEFEGCIKKENIEKLTEDFSYYFDIGTDANGDVDRLDMDDYKLNFEDVLSENAEFFEPGSFFEMIGEDGALFRWYVDTSVKGNVREEVPTILWPEDIKAGNIINAGNKKYVLCDVDPAKMNSMDILKQNTKKNFELLKYEYMAKSTEEILDEAFRWNFIVEWNTFLMSNFDRLEDNIELVNWLADMEYPISQIYEYFMEIDDAPCYDWDVMYEFIKQAYIDEMEEN